MTNSVDLLKYINQIQRKTNAKLPSASMFSNFLAIYEQ